MLGIIALILLVINIGVEALAKKRSILLFVILTLGMWFAVQEGVLYLLNEVWQWEEPRLGVHSVVASVLAFLSCLLIYWYLKRLKVPNKSKAKE